MTPAYLSPSQLRMFEQDPAQYYRVYVVQTESRTPQTLPMAIGSAFDAYVKTWLWSRLAEINGKIAGRGPGLSLDDSNTYNRSTYFRQATASISPELLGDALTHGWGAMCLYRDSRALERLVAMMMGQPGPLEMESECRATVMYDGMIISLLGRPDLYYGRRCCLDWKVNGWYSGKCSPAPGYRWVYPGHKRHPAYNGRTLGKDEWYTQIGTYLLCKGQTHGTAYIHQLCGRDRVAEHHAEIDCSDLVRRYAVLWRKWMTNDWNTLDDLCR